MWCYEPLLRRFLSLVCFCVHIKFPASASDSLCLNYQENIEAARFCLCVFVVCDWQLALFELSACVCLSLKWAKRRRKKRRLSSTLIFEEALSSETFLLRQTENLWLCITFIIISRCSLRSSIYGFFLLSSIPVTVYFHPS